MATTDRVVRACAIFGVTPGAGRAPAAGVPAARIDRMLAPGGIALLRGASGAGKSTLVRALRVRLERRGHRCVLVDPARLLRPSRRRPLIELLRGPIDGALRTLARAGLGEATLLARTPRELSEGQRWRLALALAMHRAFPSLAALGGKGGRAEGEAGGGPLYSSAPTLLADEFASTLDRPTARALALSVRRWCSAAGARLICATAHDDLDAALAPDLIAHGDPAPCDGRPDRCHGPDRSCHWRLERRSRARRCSPPRPPRLRIEPGAIADYHALARHHYRAGPPATHVLVLRATLPRGRLAGVLVVSMPTLNCPGNWRDLAWPGRYLGPRRAGAARLSREVRTISRLVVDPRFRACGVAGALLRAYLRCPLTPATEALAAMGACCPVFARAGMTEYRLPPTRRDARLADALAAAGAEPEDLLRPRRRAALLRNRLIARELRVWANGAGATRGLLRGPAAALATRAGMSLCAARVAYANTVTNP